MLICFDLVTGKGCSAQLRSGTAFCPHCGNRLTFAVRVADSGDQIGNYRILDIIGFGGFGAVYRAEDTRGPAGRVVALKEAFDGSQVSSFRDEFAILRQLQHDHLPAYYDMFESGGSGYLVMEYVPGQNLDQVLASRNAPLPVKLVLSYAVQICDALEYLHTRPTPIFHRDIKPANLRLTPDGQIKLVDFGLLKEGSDATRSSRRGLTPSYAPPEQFGLSSTNGQSDIYGLAATLYHLLTGVRPIPALDRISDSDTLPAPQTLNPAVTPALSSVILRGLAISRSERWPSIAAFQQALFSGEQPVPVPPQAPDSAKTDDTPTIPFDPNATVARPRDDVDDTATQQVDQDLTQQVPGSSNDTTVGKPDRQQPPGGSRGTAPRRQPLPPPPPPRRLPGVPRNVALSGLVMIVVIACSWIFNSVVNSNQQAAQATARADQTDVAYRATDAARRTAVANRTAVAIANTAASLSTAAVIEQTRVANQTAVANRTGWNNGPVLFQDPMDGSVTSGFADGASASLGIAVANGRLVWYMKPGVSVPYPLSQSFTAATISTDIRFPTTAFAGAGLTFGYADDNNFFIALVYRDGACSIDQRVNGEYEQLLLIEQCVAADSLSEGVTLGVGFAAGTIDLFINDRLIDTATHTKNPTGQAGLFLATGNDAATVSFDDFIVRER